MLIALNETQKSQLDELVEAGDPSIRGVATALPEAGIGRAVTMQEIQVGDFMQYWERTSNDTWEGHAGVVEEIEIGDDGKRAVRLFGAHESINGVGSSKYEVDLIKKDGLRIYAARLTE